MKEHTIEFIILLFTMLALGWALMRGIDQSIQNQDVMLCNSAKISGNVQWLHKCECYYETNNIKCLQEVK
jgi:hypothetical protein